MPEPLTTRSGVMIVVGLLMLAVSAVVVFLTSEPGAVVVAVIGLVFLAMGHRAPRR